MTAASRDDVSFPQDAHAALAGVEGESFWFNHRNAIIERVVRRHPPGGEILDVGGGNGVVAEHLQGVGIPCSVLEPDRDGARMARHRGLNVFELEFSQYQPTAPLAACSFFDVIEHIDDSSGALKRAHTTLAAGGHLYITVPAHAWLWSLEDVSAGHFRRYSITSLEDEVKKAGFEIQYASYFFGFLVGPVAVFRTLPTLLGVAKTSTAATADAHRPPHAAVASAMSATFKHELAAVEAGRRLSLGTSIILAARKPI